MSLTLAEEISDATLDLEGLEVNLNLLARIVTDNLTFSLWARAEPVNYQYSPPAWINSSGQEESSIQKLKERVA